MRCMRLHWRCEKSHKQKLVRLAGIEPTTLGFGGQKLPVYLNVLQRGKKPYKSAVFAL